MIKIDVPTLRANLLRNKPIVFVVESSNLSTLCYNPQSKKLVILFKKGTIYTYKNVGLEVINKVLQCLQKNESMGRAFRTYIMNKYNFTRLNENETVKYKGQ